MSISARNTEKVSRELCLASFLACNYRFRLYHTNYTLLINFVKSVAGIRASNAASAIAASFGLDVSFAQCDVRCLLIGLHPDNVFIISANCDCVNPALSRDSLKIFDILLSLVITTIFEEMHVTLTFVKSRQSLS